MDETRHDAASLFAELTATAQEIAHVRQGLRENGAVPAWCTDAVFDENTRAYVTLLRDHIRSMEFPGPGELREAIRAWVALPAPFLPGSAPAGPGFTQEDATDVFM